MFCEGEIVIRGTVGVKKSPHVYWCTSSLPALIFLLLLSTK